MNKALDAFIKRLETSIKTNRISKIELNRKTGISRNMIDRYLKGAIPGLDIIEKIAEALNIKPWELIQPLNIPVVRTHTLDDCLEAVRKAAKGEQQYRSQISEGLIPADILNLISKLDDHRRENYFEMMRETLIQATSYSDDEDDVG